jgi:hypothetical protein
MESITEFYCPRKECQYHCSKGAQGDERCQELWNKICGSLKGWAMVKCPGCRSSIFQCRFCDDNLHPEDEETKAKLRRGKVSAYGYMKRHVKRICKHSGNKRRRVESSDESNNLFQMGDDLLVAEEDPPHELDEDVVNTFDEHMRGSERTDDLLDGDGDPFYLDNNNEGADPFNVDNNNEGVDDPFNVDNKNDTVDICQDLINAFAEYVSDDDGSVNSDGYCFGHDLLVRSQVEMECLQRMSETKADEYVQELQHLDLDPFSEWEDETDNLEEYGPTLATREAEDNSGNSAKGDHLSFDAFKIFAENYNPNPEKKKKVRNKRCPNQVYFYQKYKYKLSCTDSDQGGFLGLVGRSNCGDPDDINAMVDEVEGDCMFDLFQMLMNMSESTRLQMCRYQKKLFKLFDLQKQKPSVKTRFPTTEKDLKKKITVGKASILKNFPVQEVFEIDGHACVSLIETIRLMAGHGAEYCFALDGKTRNKEGLNGQKAMDKLIDEINDGMKRAGVEDHIRVKTKIGGLLFWSDGFLNCFIKQKENSVWIITVTVCPPHESKSSHMYTYVLAMGRNDADHTPVIQHYMREVSELRKGIDCYFGNSNTIERVALDILAWLADRPENHELTCTRKEGTYGKVNGWAVNVSEERLAACTHCFMSMITKLTAPSAPEENVSSLCTNCSNWCLVRKEDGERKIECMNDRVSKDYPKQYPERRDVAPQPEGRTCHHEVLPPVKLTTKWMLGAVRSGYFGVRLGNWGIPKAREYLRTCNINDKTSLTIINGALEDKKKGVINVERVEPLFWKQIDCFSSFKFPLLPLHGLCHGIIPDVMAVCHQIFKRYRKMDSFCNYANPFLEDVASFRLSYLKIKKLPKAAWMGENSLAFSRLMPYVYGTYLMNNSLGTSEEGKVIVKFIICLLNSFHALMTIFMSRAGSHPGAIDDHIKLFMSSAHYLHKQHGQLDTSEKTSGDLEGEGGQATTKKKTFVELQSRETLMTLLREMDQPDNGNVGQLRKRLSKVTVNELKAKLKALVPGITMPSQKKDDLLVQLSDQVIHIDEEDSSNVDVGDDGETIQTKTKKREKMCWNKGNWLSFMAEISEQIDNLGQLYHIW